MCWFGLLSGALYDCLFMRFDGGLTSGCLYLIGLDCLLLFVWLLYSLVWFINSVDSLVSFACIHVW